MTGDAPNPNMTSLSRSDLRATRLRQPPAWRLLRGLGVIVIVTTVAIAGVLWWNDRPIRAIERTLAQQDFERAARQADAYLAVDPESVQVLDQKARALAGLEQWSEAARIFERIGTDSVASQRAFSQALLHQERWSEALPLLTRLGKLFPDDADVLHELTACQAKLGLLDEAIASAGHLMQLAGNESRGRLLLGMLHFRRGNNRLAIQAWQPILESNPEAADLQWSAAEFFAALGRALLDDGQAAQARPYLERVVRLDPTVEARNALAEACEQTGDLPQAVVLWRQVAAHNPADRAAREGLARTALENKAADEARDWLQPLIERGDMKSSTAYLMQRAAVIAGDKTTAASWEQRVQSLRKQEKKLSAIDQALRESPQSYWSRAVRAHRFASEGNARQALLLTEELLHQDPDQPFVKKLDAALRDREALPSLDLIPFEQF